MTELSLDHDRYWARRLRPLPIRVAPLPGELMVCYLRRLAHANSTDLSLLIRHLGNNNHHGTGPIDTHDLALNRSALARLATLSGYPETTLLAAIPVHVIGILDPEPFRYWTPLGLNKDGTLVHPCSRCAARRGAYEPTIVKIGTREPPICIRHRRTLALYRFDDVQEHSLTATPEIVTAARRHRALRRRYPTTSDLAFVTASHLTSTWRSWSVESRSGRADRLRWNARAQHLPGIPDSLIRYPETIAFTALFASTPSLMLTIRNAPGAPSPMQFLLAAVRCLNHPAPEQVLRRSHALNRWAGVPLQPLLWWANTAEPTEPVQGRSPGTASLGGRPNDGNLSVRCRGDKQK